MDFNFSEDQLLFQQTVRDFLDGECTPGADPCAVGRRSPATTPELWVQLAELGIPGLLVPEAHDGMGLDETDSVLLFEEAGRAALAAPMVTTAAVAAPLLAELEDRPLAEKLARTHRPGRGHRRGRHMARAPSSRTPTSRTCC